MLKTPALAVAVAVATATTGLAQEPSVERLDPALDQLLDVDAPIRMLGDGFRWTEGPVWVPAAGELLFCDIPGNVIHAWHPETGMRQFMKPSG